MNALASFEDIQAHWMLNSVYKLPGALYASVDVLDKKYTSYRLKALRKRMEKDSHRMH